LELLWNRTSTQPRARIVLTRLATTIRDGAVDSRSGVDGPSIGLALLLSMASSATGLLLPSDLLATAEVTVRGEVLAVGGLERKLAGLARMAPGIRRVVIARDQEVGEVPDGLELVRVSTGRQALQEVFQESEVVDALVAAGQDPSRREAVLRDFFFASMRGRTEMVRWRSRRRAALAALENWPDLDPDESNQLRLAVAVASRFDDREVSPVELPDPQWVLDQPPARKGAILAQLVQQANDTGVPSLAQVDELLSHVTEAEWTVPSSPFLRLRGARARLWATRTRELAERALVEQEAAARAFLDLLQPAETTYGLSEWFRLAGLLGDREAFERALAYETVVTEQGGMAQGGGTFVSLNTAWARVCLGRDLPWVVGAVQAIERGVGAYWSDVRDRARRLRAQALDGLGKPEDAKALRSIIETPLQRALARVDVGADPSVLVEHADVPMRRLLDGPLDAARWYPY